jgi:hypothetical protein
MLKEQERNFSYPSLERQNPNLVTSSLVFCALHVMREIVEVFAKEKPLEKK